MNKKPPLEAIYSQNKSLHPTNTLRIGILTLMILQWILPWLNVQALQNDPMRLISLLQNRTKYSPQEWAAFDYENLRFGFHKGYLELNYSPLCVVMLGHNYGALVPWNKESAHRMDIIGFHIGQLILQAQETVLKFLCKIIDLSTEGLQEIPKTLDFQQNHYVLEQKRSGRTELWFCFSNKSFSEPPSFDLSLILSLAEANLNSMADHIWLMQTDDAYFRRTIRYVYFQIMIAKKSLIIGKALDY